MQDRIGRGFLAGCRDSILVGADLEVQKFAMMVIIVAGMQVAPSFRCFSKEGRAKSGLGSTIGGHPHGS